jgi:PAS domain S-box-containing protein
LYYIDFSQKKTWAKMTSSDHNEQTNNFDYLDKVEAIARVIQQERDVEKLLWNVCEKVLEIFKCDRAWLLFPCDPTSAAWHVPVECTVPEYPGASAKDLSVEMTPDVAEVFQTALETNSPIVYGPRGLPLTQNTKSFGVKSQLSMAIYPIFGKPWQFGIHQCSFERTWTENEIKLFNFIGVMITEALGNLLLFRDQQKTKEKLEERVSERTITLQQEITEREKTEKALRVSEEKFRSIFKASPMGIFLFKLKDNDRLIFLEANKAATQILGVDCQQFIGKPIEEAFPSLTKTKLPKRFKQTCMNGTPMHVEQLEYDDSLIKGTYELYAFQTAPGMIAILFMDLSDRIQFEAEKQKIINLESIGLLAGGIAHDFNNLLASIFGNIELASDNLAEGSETKEFLSQATSAMKRAKHLTGQLLTFAQGQLLPQKIHSLKEIVHNAVDFIFSGSSVDCKISIPMDIWPIKANKSQIEQVFQNLALNAKEAIQEYGVFTVEAKNTLITSEKRPLSIPPGKYVRVEVKDNGIGISEKIINKIFNPYFSTKQKGEDKGTGLGLAICHSIITKHQGFISVESEKGKGTIFSLHLPVSDTPNAVEKKPSPQLHKETILILEDESSVARMLTKMLLRLGYKSESFKDGKDLITRYKEALAQNTPHDAVILDLTIRGGMGGRETLEKLCELTPEIKAIVASGYADNIVIANYTDYGFQAALVKPFLKKNLKDTLEYVLNI